MENLDSDMLSQPKLGLDNDAKDYLLLAAKWARFLAIVGFVFCALMTIVAFFVGAIFSTLGNMVPNMAMMGGSVISAAFTGLYLIAAALMFFPCWYLFQFATKAIASIKKNDTLSESFKNLKSCFKFHGVVVIVMLSFYSIVIVFALIGFMAK